jgi:thiol-disulfide isomerase/thioredoxin
MLRQPIALLSFLAVLALTACDEGNANRLNTGDIAPTFTASSLGGAPVSFPDDLRGRPVVIRFLADWCRYCENEMKAIERAAICMPSRAGCSQRSANSRRATIRRPWRRPTIWSLQRRQPRPATPAPA